MGSNFMSILRERQFASEFPDNQSQEGNMISDANQMLAEISRPGGCPKHDPDFFPFPWKLIFSRFLIPQRGSVPHHLISRCETYLSFDIYKRFHSHKVVSEDFYRKTGLDGGQSSNVLGIL